MNLSNSASPQIGPAPPCATPSVDDGRWFAAEVHSHDARLKAYLRGSFPAVRDVDDVVQESYLRILRRRAAEPIRSAKAFLFQTARHLALDFVRRSRSSPFEEVRDLSALPVLDNRLGAPDALCRKEKIRLLAEAIHDLPPRCQKIFVLRRLHLVSQKEVAAQLGLSERTVEVHVQNGLRRCEAYLRERGVRGLFDDDPS